MYRSRQTENPARLALALAAIAAGAIAAPEASAADAADKPDVWAHGRLDLGYIYRTTAGNHDPERERDQDLLQDVFLEAGKGANLRAEASMRFREDIDGKPEVSTFRDVYDTFDNPAFFLYTGFAEALDAGLLARARLGRQYYAEGVDLRFDGGLVETNPLGDAVKLAAYGGIPVHLFESSRRGDWLAGGAAELVAIPRTTVRLDYAHVTDIRDDLLDARRTDGVDRDVVRDDDYFQLFVTHRLTRTLRVLGTASTFEGRSSRFSADGIFDDPAIELSARLRYVAQLGAYRDLSIQFTPLDEALGEYAPYHEVYGDVRKGFFEVFGIGGGFAVRQLQNARDEGPFNHEFQRYFVRADLADVPWKGLSAFGTAEMYRSDAGDRTYELSGDVSQELGAFVVGGGTSFALFKFDEFFLEERERVRSTFARVEWKPVKWLRPRLEYSFTKDDEDEYHVVRFDVRLSF